jgi:hypothetical protein
MLRAQASVTTLAERMCRPQRLGVFGHRGVGKTTLLTLLYREAVSGRLPDLRLAAADTRTANYLSDKVLQLEAGHALPGTLAETDLRFHLYNKTTRLELLVKDYQGEHVELGRQEPIREFLRDCDAIWLCLDSGLASSPEANLRRQQEVEQAVEDYLATDPVRSLHRPMALVMTKADRLEADALADGQWAEPFCMTRHALESHHHDRGLFVTSCLAPNEPKEARVASFRLHPIGLAEPLCWLAAALQAQDEARLEWLWIHAGGQLQLLERCVACFARRYPDAPATTAFRQRLRQARWQRRRQRGLSGVAASLALALSLWGYDALGYYQAERFETAHTDAPAAAVARWESFQSWHPLRHLTRISSADAEEARLGELRLETRSQECQGRLADLRRRAADPDAEAESLWSEFQNFHSAYPEISVAGNLEQLRYTIKARRDEEVTQRAQVAYDELVSAEGKTSDTAVLVEQADRFLQRFAGTPQESDVRRRRAAYLDRVQERVIDVARNYSAKNPLNFQTRREHYQHYLDKFPTGAAAKEAQAALAAIDRDWDKHDFRAVRDHFLSKTGDIPELVARCRTYLAVHPQGQFTAAATELLRWSERVTVPGEYRVVLRNGQFDKKIARWFSRGPSLSVEIEVNGVLHGPSSFYKHQYEPEWNYEYPRRIRWKLGDPVVIRVIDNDWGKRVLIEISSADGDPLALRLLCGEVSCGANYMTFASDFRMPVLPQVE